MSLKQNVLERLREAEDYVSGQQLCEAFDVSRTAVWKAIGRLKEEGYPIEAVTNKGYRLLSMEEKGTDLFNEAEIACRLTTKWAGRTLCFKEETGSTNTDIFAMAQNGAPQGTLVAAARQTAGKGRRGRSWFSPEDGNVYFSLLLRPAYAAAVAPMVTPVAALAVYEALQELAADGKSAQSGPVADGKSMQPGPVADGKSVQPGPADGGKSAQLGPVADGKSVQPALPGVPDARFGIKWPNDIVAQRDGGAWKKICGILTEMHLEDAEIADVIIGIGINVNIARFPEEIQETATSVARTVGRPVSRATLAAAVWNHFERLYERFEAAQSLAPLKEEYETALVNLGRTVRVLDPQEPFVGTAVGVTDSGELLVRTEDGAVRCVGAGEVSVRGVEGYV